MILIARKSKPFSDVFECGCGKEVVKILRSPIYGRETIELVEVNGGLRHRGCKSAITSVWEVSNRE